MDNRKIIKKVSKKIERFPASLCQQRIWRIYNSNKRNNDLPSILIINIEGELVISHLQKAFKLLVEKNHILRTAFDMVDGGLYQVICKSEPFELSVCDEFKNKHVKFEGNITNGLRSVRTNQMIGATLYKISATEHKLIFKMNNLIFDYFSRELLFDQLVNYYKAFCVNDDAMIYQNDCVQFVEFSEYQNQRLRDESFSISSEYWRNEVSDSPVLLNIIDYLYDSNEQNNNNECNFLINKFTLNKIENISSRMKSSVEIVLLTVLSILLRRYTNSSDIIIAKPKSVRPEKHEKKIGPYTNIVPIRTKFSEKSTFSELIDKVKKTVQMTETYEDFPFERIVRELSIEHSEGFNPLCQVSFLYSEKTINKQQFQKCKFELEYSAPYFPEFDLSFVFKNFDDSLLGTINYNSRMYSEVFINRMVQHFQILIEDIFNDISKDVLQYNMISEAERQKVLYSWNSKLLDYPKNICIGDIVANHSKVLPDKIAVVSEKTKITYRELEKRANQLAYYLAGLGVESKDLVGISIDRSLEVVLCILGIWKVGCGYIPFDINLPQDRLSKMYRNAQPRVIITTKDNVNNHIFYNSDLLYLEDISVLDRFPIHFPNKAKPSSIAYIIYTSGTTGEPKGVIVEHNSLINIGYSYLSEYRLNENDTILSLSSISFDVFISDVIKTIMSLGTMVICPSRSLLDMNAIYQLIVRERVTHIDSTPGLVIPLMDFIYKNGKSTCMLSTILIGADYVKVSDYNLLRDRFGDKIRIINGYGITETTIESSYYEGDVNNFSRNASAFVSIGKPHPNTRYYILNEKLIPQPIGVIGELFIGGPGVARGYHKQPDLTNLRYLDNPFLLDDRIYKTGDYARWDEDGNVQFVGRLDDQIKVRGYRIELGEIESNLEKHRDVDHAVVLAKDIFKTNENILVAYLYSEYKKKIGDNELRLFLSKSLPSYMIPVVYIWMNEVPKNYNGKIDRKYLESLHVEVNLNNNNYRHARDYPEIELQKIWEQLLKINPISIDENFFELGGNSLMLIQLYEKVLEIFSIDIPLPTLLENPTLVSMAAQIRELLSIKILDIPMTEHSLVPLKETGNKQPIFLVHPIGGYLFAYTELVRNISPDQPVFGFRVSKTQQEKSLEQLADRYVDELIKFDPYINYNLVGYSFGGILAFEMARNLKKKGFSVNLLGLIDTSIGKETENPSDFELLLEFIERYSPTEAEIGKLRSLDFESQIQMSYDIGRKCGLIEEGRAYDSFKTQIITAINNSRIEKKYKAQKYEGKITLFKATDGLSDATEGWSDLTSQELLIVSVPGTHFSIMRPPHVSELANEIEKTINQAPICGNI
ncbi:amino acid adenylation domain-containing protein [Brevibacillus reuszeri]|uniref:amino acid adenylation domain-containing protein n=1 Tax=Brevibacillus reuszeri TaxID=54915 RepID=UPI003D24976A